MLSKLMPIKIIKLKMQKIRLQYSTWVKSLPFLEAGGVWFSVHMVSKHCQEWLLSVEPAELEASTAWSPPDVSANKNKKYSDKYTNKIINLLSFKRYVKVEFFICFVYIS